MPLTYRQKTALETMIVFLCTGCFLGGIIFYCYWLDTTASVQKYCSRSTLITITVNHGGDTGVAVKVNGCK